MTNSSISTISNDYSNEKSNDSFRTSTTNSSSCSVASSQKYRIRTKIKEMERENVLQELETKHSQLKDRAELIESVIIEMVDFIMTKDNI